MGRLQDKVCIITGAAGGVVLRPFARLVSSAGDSLTTYGKAWTMS